MIGKKPSRVTMKPSRVTMKDVAVAAGVSQSTVSFVLNGLEDMRIGAETKDRVLAAAERLGYRHRSAGRPASRNVTRVIGMLVDEIATSPFAAISIEGAQEQAWSQGTVLDVAMTGGDPDYENVVLRRWEQDGVAGVIYASILTREVSPPALLARHRAILLNCADAQGRFPGVVPAERRGSEAATIALIEAGCRRVAFVSGEPWMAASQQREEGYRRALATHGITPDPALILEGNFLPSGGRAATLRLMQAADPPEAIFCANDLMAVGAYEAIKELGLKVGRDVAVMGYDDQEIAQHLAPPLSTVLLPHREMGQWCALRLLDDKPMGSEAFRIPCPLVPRASHYLQR
jgi:LacI family transcriptional regulator